MRRWPYLAISASVVILDQATKALVVSTVPNGGSKPLFSWFAIVHWLNTGGLWGSFQDLSPVPRMAIFFALPILGLGLLAYLFMKAKGPLELVLISAILGGALGNLADRVRLGAVVDFLYFHLPSGKWGWPAFNVADACLSTGIILLVALGLFSKEDGKEKNAPNPV